MSEALFRSDAERYGARRVQASLVHDSAYIASLEPYWALAHGGVSPADAIGCSDDTWLWIAICRRPRNGQFQFDLDKIASEANVERDRLAHFIVTSLTAERFNGAPAIADDDSALLRAARERDEKDSD
jgi:hypothetical protein